MFPLNATGGSVVFQGGCDSSGEFCNVSALASMRITFSNVIVAGTTIANVDGQLTEPAGIVVSGGVGRFRGPIFASTSPARLPEARPG